VRGVAQALPPSSAAGTPGVLAEAVRTLRPPRGERHGPLPPLMLALTVVTGVVDAVSFLRLGHVFVANMTGNVVFLGFALAGAAGLSAGSSLAAIGAFMVGALVGGRVAARLGVHRGRMLRLASALQATLLAAALAIAIAGSSSPGAGERYALIVALALAMGLQNASAQRLAIPELTTTVLTRTLTGMLSEARVVGGPGAQAGRRLLAVGAMLLGAIAGALLALNVSIAAALSLAVAIVALVAIAIHLLSATSAPWARP
jgi:uncharacterized membrane protein YoaK (UPF0700 family)